MNNFENQVAREYTKNHEKDLFKKSVRTAYDYEDVADFHETQEQEMSIAFVKRFTTLALEQYHIYLTNQLKKYDIQLPDFATLTEIHDE